MGEVVLEGLQKRYVDDQGRIVEALKDFSVKVPSSEFFVLLGPSGCGKTTALNSVAGLVELDAGRIQLAERVVFESGASRVNVPPDKRDIGMVFQTYALWPHMTVAENVYFPLRARGEKWAEARPRVRDALDLVQCGAFAERHPAELSGGQQQRIALARAIVAEPRVILFDEPLSNLDANLRAELRETLADLHARLQFTGIYVTHDQIEALSLGTLVAVMQAGSAVQIGTPQEIYNRPATAYVADFFGANVFRVSARERTSDAVLLGSAFGPLKARRGGGEETGAERQAAIYPHHVALRPSEDATAVVAWARFGGTRWEYSVTAPTGERLRIVRPAVEPVVPAGTRVEVEVSPEHVYLLEAVRQETPDPEEETP